MKHYKSNVYFSERKSLCDITTWVEVTTGQGGFNSIPVILESFVTLSIYVFILIIIITVQATWTQ